MITIIDSGKLVNTDVSPMVPRSCEMVGLSTDTKPTGVSVGNGWSFIEMDTGKVFFYNAADEEWLEFAGSGGGGGQGGNSVLVVGIDAATGVLDKTWQEIYDAPYAVVQSRDEVNKFVSYLFVVQISIMGANQFLVGCLDPQNPQPAAFIATTASGYPVLQNGN